ncbi:unnamed protein product [Caenorhabditis auriculariae]|uniref:LIM zinc-binding domain-containing protein n=1 Tax=Caenorhabditis auriculariae TaxID=2777116 RepID=A0A8S1HXA7_9PELO|nr:unnamed protein product [Caenorhabditis auriculariae]
MKKERPRTPETLKEMIKNCEKDVEPRQPKQNARSRRRSQISKEQVQQAFREHQARSEAQKSSQEGGTQEKAQKSSSEPQEQVQQSYKMPPAQEQIFNKPQAQEQVQGSFRVPQAQNQAQQSFRQAQAQERVQESYKAPQVQVQEENFRAPEQSFRVPQAQQQVFQKPQAHEQVQKSNQLPQAQERVQETFQAPQTKDKVQQPYRAPQNAVFRKPQAHELLQQSYIVPQGQGQVQQTYRVPQPQQQVQKSFQVPRTQEKAQETYRAPPAQDPTVSEAAVAESVTLDVSITSHKPPEIRDGKIHWTVIHSPKTSPVGPAPPRITTSKPEPEIRRPIPVLPNNSERSKNSYSERELTRPLPVPAAPVVNVSAPEPSIASQKSPIEISRTSIPKPFTSSQAPKKAVSSVNFSEVERPSELKESSVSLKPSAVETADSSTSPIPVVRLQRRRESKEEPLPPTPMVQNSKEQPKLTASPVPFPSVLRHQQKLEEQKLKPASPIPLIQVEKNSSAEEDTTESVIPREPVYLKKPPPKVLKKVDFSRATVIPDTNRWADNADIVDESDILTEASRDEDSISLPNFDYKTTEFLRTSAVYDGDESEMIDNKSDVASTLDMDEEQEQDQEPEPEQRHQKGTSSSSQVAPDAEKQWRQRAMELLEDDAQTERDLMIVAALNERLQGLREMEDEDRLRAIECIARHQNDLEQTQTQLSSLLESAIVYLQNLGVTGSGKEENENENEEEDEVTERPPTPPQRKYFSTDVKTESLLDVLDEWQSITFNNNNLHDHQRQPEGSSVTIRSGSDIVGRPQWQRDERDDVVERSKTFLAERLARQMNLGDENATTNERRGNVLLIAVVLSGHCGTYTKTVTEQTTEQRRPYTGPGSGQEFRGTGSLTTTTQHQGGRIPFCEACKQQIRGAFVLATGLAWCPEHFVCANRACGRRLLECGFVEERGEKFCESCFERDIAPRCAKCIKAIVSDCLNALQKKWHPTCFTCAHCQKPFGNSAFYLEQGLPYCERDWNALFTTKCVSCTYPIEAGDRWVEALNNAFHSNCFTCTSCHHNLEGESFFAKNGLPFCKLHA